MPLDNPADGVGTAGPPQAGTAGDSSRGGGRRETFALSLLFGTMYFVQGLAEPTEGLIAQPVISLLDSWRHSPAQITRFAALVALPWSLKPLYGLLTDFVPLAGYRRKSYLVLASAATIAGLVALYLLPLAPGWHNVLLVLLIVPTIGVAFSDVVIDALMVEKGQPRGITGRLQAAEWGAMFTATIVAGTWGGRLSEQRQEKQGFLVSGAVTAVTLVVTLLCVAERPHAAPRAGLGKGARVLGRAARNPAVLAVGGFLFLWNFNPFSNAVLQLYMTKELGLGEQFYGNMVSLSAVGSIAACLGYGLYCRRVPRRVLVEAAIVLGIASNLAYLALVGQSTAVPISLAAGFTTMTAILIQLDLAAQSCPPQVAGTVFALLMGASNLSTLLATWLGGQWYELGVGRWGSHAAFDVLVGAGALATAACWLVAPAVHRSLGREVVPAVIPRRKRLG